MFGSPLGLDQLTMLRLLGLNFFVVTRIRRTWDLSFVCVGFKVALVTLSVDKKKSCLVGLTVEGP